jgi:hypothetical protein
MWMTYLDIGAAVLLLIMAVLVSANGAHNKILFKVVPTMFAFALGASAMARIFGWPI